MGADPEARLAYGYDLGDIEDPKIVERGEYGGYTLDWLNTVDNVALELALGRYAGPSSRPDGGHHA